MTILFVTRQNKEQVLGQKGVVIWFTGLPCSGKTTLANNLQSYLFSNQFLVCVLDGDLVRKGLNSDLDFSEKGRKENIRRISEVSKLFSNTGIITIVSTISPFCKDRSTARNILGTERFVEVYLDCPIDECEKRDVKGHYKLARKNKIPNFTGVSSPYEHPINPDIHIKTDILDLQACTDKITKFLIGNNFIPLRNEE
jgi:adenylylsulfate kinase